jgi:hypothetical protein
MKKKILIFSIFLFSFIPKQISKNKEIEFKVLNKSLKDSTEVEIQVTNFSKFNYYLLLDTNGLKEKLAPFQSSCYLSTVFLGIIDSKNKNIGLQLNDLDIVYPERKKFFVKDLFKLKSGEKKTFKMPFKLKTIINEYVWLEYKVDKSKLYSTKVEYNIQNKFLQNILSKRTKDSLQKMGYKLYNKQITSNKVPLILKK